MSHSGWTAAWQVGEWKGWGHGQEGGRDASHSRWTAAWCLTMSKIQAYAFFFRSTHVAWGACVGDTVPKKLLPCPPLPRCHRHLHSLNVTLSMAPMLMHTCLDPNHASSSPPLHPGKLPHRQRHAMSRPMTTQDVPHSSGYAPAPLTCPAPSQCAAAIPHPHISHTPFVRPSPSHNRTHVPQPSSMRPGAFLHAPPHPFLTCRHHPRRVPCALHVPPISCSFS